MSFPNSLKMMLFSEAVVRMSSIKKVAFLEILQNSQESTCVRDSFLIKLLTIGLQLYSKRVSGKDVFQWILQTF